MKEILVTGGAGYIGSHTVLQLLQAGHSVLVLDNFSNSKPEALQRVQVLAAEQLPSRRGLPMPRLSVIDGDVRDAAVLARCFAEHDIDAVIHFAGLKAVGESVAKPLSYYDNNVVGSVQLLAAMEQAGVHRLVFSSSATVYGDPQSVPIHEDAPLSTNNPYGATKLHIEDMLRDVQRSAPDRWQFAILRYFNPVGAHESGLIGEDPNGIPNNLMPFIAQVASGKLPCLRVFGADYNTPDGTGVRDYIHVVDLADGHLKALQYLDQHQVDAPRSEPLTVNLGTGCGYSVLEMITAFEAASGESVPYELVARRSGDVAQCYADPQRAERLLGWRASRGQAEMCRDHWRWQSNNPQGYLHHDASAS